MQRTNGAVACAVSIASLLALALGGAACGGAAAGGAPRTDGSALVRAATGGTVTLASGPTLQIPAGALAADTTITIQETAETGPGGAPVYQFSPAGTTFAAPVTLTLPNPQGLTSAAVYWSQPGSATAFTALPATVTADGISASVTHFSFGFVGAPCDDGALCTPASSACHVGSVSCSSGAPVCEDTGAAVEEGLSCGAGFACAAGTCGALPLVALSVTPVEPVVVVAGTIPFVATAVATDGESRDVTGEVAWSSSDATVATVSNDPASAGIATAAGSVTFGATTATITATIDGEQGPLSASTLLSVCAADLPAPVQSSCGDVGVTPQTMVVPGSTITITVQQGSGPNCGGGLHLGVAAPGAFVDATGGTVNGTNVTYPALDAGTALRTATFQLSANPADWASVSKCPTGQWAPNGNEIFMMSGPWVSAYAAWYEVAAPFTVSQ